MRASASRSAFNTGRFRPSFCSYGMMSSRCRPLGNSGALLSNFGQSIEDSGSDRLNQFRRPRASQALKGLRSTVLPQCSDQHFNQCIDGFVLGAEPLDLLNCMQDGGVVTSVVEPADLDHAPATDVLGQIHRNLPTEARTLFIACDASRSEMSGNR